MKTTQTLLTVLGSLALAGSANAQIIVQWNFNGPATNSVPGGLLSPLPSSGSGTASLVGGVTAPNFFSGTANGGSTDPVNSTPPNYAWQTTTYAAQGTEDLTRGVQFALAGPVPIPLGATGLEVKWDQRHSNASSRWARFQYSLDGGTTWTQPTGSLFEGNAGDTWFNNRTVSLPGVLPGMGGFMFQILATFAPSTSGYAASNPTASYAPSGTWRFDMVTVSFVPEPHEYAMLAGLGLVGFAIWRRRAAK